MKAMMKIFLMVVVILVMAWMFSGCALTNAQVYAIKKYADAPERFGYKCPWDETDKRYTYNRNNTDRHEEVKKEENNSSGDSPQQKIAKKRSGDIARAGEK